ncbi:curved DNA-binding protein [Algoriphagus iocasae]|uniref:Curved DNA-binding protein n=1 Tax=Algoriphagus iocasae TaxID=1836499 RepID=A0A841MCC7_9BACT|nr:J domain-containing protein [Algoriphagus iocasae]MBB6325702.1 curved DNA-binding protein [Algoriphagus iocasae]
MAYIDYYKTLGIPKTATEKEIKDAYRKLARKYHPDLNPDNKEAESKFKEINEANEVLSNPENRKKYDKYGENWKHGEEFEKAQKQRQQQSQYSGQGGFSGQQGFSGEDYSDFFESMFGAGGRRTSGRSHSPKFKGQDYHAELHLDLKDVYTTQKQVLTVNDKKIRLTIPAGVENEQLIKIKGNGGEGYNGGPNGDLYIKFIISNQTYFKREGNNLYKDVDLDLYTSILGGEILVDTFDGKVKLKVQPETKNHTKVKLKGKGFPVYKKEGEFGDLILTYQVKIPTNLSAKEKELFQELKKLRHHD